MKRADDDNRWRQIAMGAAILAGLAAAFCGTLVGWRHLPGLLGEWVGLIVGVMTTPFLLEASCGVIGLTLVLAINYWRQNRAGDELVYLERVDTAAVPDGLPDHARWAVYQNEPLPGEIPTMQAQAEGAMAIGDFATAAECLGAMAAADLKRPETLAVRMALAQATGRHALAAQLAAELRAMSPTTGMNTRSMR
jgi:hypothetical protein